MRAPGNRGLFVGIAAFATSIAAVRAQIPASRIPKWEAASIKRCTNESGGEQSASLNDSLNRIRLSCYPVPQLIQDAYVLFAGGHWAGSHPGAVKIERLPGWANSERYTVEAKAEGNPGQMVMLGPMLQSLLESRFSLKTHSETRNEPAYALAVSRSGFNVQPFKGGCIPEDPLSPDPTPVKNTCPRTQQDWPMSLDTFAWWLNGLVRILDAPVLNKTGITGYFRFNWEPFQKLPRVLSDSPQDRILESVRAALQPLGLNLQTTSAPRRYLVVDQVERPSPN